MAFSQLVSAFQGFFSRGFWFGSFLPVALAAAIHAFLAQRVYPDFSPWDLLTGTGSHASKFPLIFAMAVVLAYAMTPLLPWIRNMLDGSLLPGWLHDALRKEHAASARKTRDKIGQAYLLYGRFQNLRQRWTDGFRKARLAGSPPGDAAAKAAAQEALKQAQHKVQALRKTRDAGTLPSIEDTEAACIALDRALRMNSAEQDPELDQCHRLLFKLLEDAEVDSRHSADSFAERSGPAIALLQPQATRMADARRLTERYCEDAYSVQFEYLWPRLQLQLPDSGSTFDRIIATRAQSDFSLLSLVLMLSVAVVWIPLLAIYDDSPWFLCGLGIMTPLAVAFFYQLALESELAFGALVKALVDRYRFDVLKNLLRQPLPVTLNSERELWSNLARSQTPGLPTDMSYRHPTS